ncbi:MAG: hypothetical protein ABFC38_14195 [Methanospirillum sp.]
MLLRLFSATYKDFLNRDYFQEAFGYHCVDAGFIPGIAGDDVGAYLFRKLRRDLWPIEERAKDFSEEDLFDVIEFLYDSVSKPVEGYYHHWDDCGWHYNTFDNQAGQKEFREEINDILLGYSDGYGLDAEGEIVYSGDFGLGELLDEQLPEEDPFDVHDKIKYAIKRFRHHRASIEDKQEAVRVLADVLEPLRSTVADLTTKKDAGDLFNIANNFAIRHNNLLQQADYDKNIYLKWIFYWYLATIHLALDVISQRE